MAHAYSTWEAEAGSEDSLGSGETVSDNQKETTQ